MNKSVSTCFFWGVAIKHLVSRLLLHLRIRSLGPQASCREWGKADIASLFPQGEENWPENRLLLVFTCGRKGCKDARPRRRSGLHAPHRHDGSCSGGSIGALLADLHIDMTMDRNKPCSEIVPKICSALPKRIMCPACKGPPSCPL